jgi:hypothetical protein
MSAVSTSNFKAPDIFNLKVNFKDKPEHKKEKINKHNLKSNSIHQEFMNKRKSSIIEDNSDMETFQLEENNVLVNVSVKMSNFIEH